MKTADCLNHLTKEVIGAAIEDHRHLGLLMNFHTVRLAGDLKRIVHNFPQA